MRPKENGVDYVPVVAPHFSNAWLADGENLRVDGPTLEPVDEVLHVKQDEVTYLKCEGRLGSIRYKAAVGASQISANGSDFTAFHVFFHAEQSLIIGTPTLRWGTGTDYAIELIPDIEATLKVTFGGVESTWTEVGHLFLNKPVCIAIRKKGSDLSVDVISFVGVHSLDTKTHVSSIALGSEQDLSFFEDPNDSQLESREGFIAHFHYNDALSTQELHQNYAAIQRHYLKPHIVNRYRVVDILDGDSTEQPLDLFFRFVLRGHAFNVEDGVNKFRAPVTGLYNVVIEGSFFFDKEYSGRLFSSINDDTAVITLDNNIAIRLLSSPNKNEHQATIHVSNMMYMSQGDIFHFKIKNDAIENNPFSVRDPIIDIVLLQTTQFLAALHTT